MISDVELDQILAACRLAEEWGDSDAAFLVLECVQVRALVDTIRELRGPLVSLPDGTPILKAKIQR